MGQGFSHQLPVLVRRVACDDVTISRARLLYIIAFILLSASLVTAYAALRPRDGFSHPHQEHMKDTYKVLFALI